MPLVLWEVGGLGFFVCFFVFFGWRILVLQLGIRPMSPAELVWNPNHWTAKEFPV